MVTEIRENRISVLETKSGSTPPTNEIQIYLFPISSRKLHKNYQISGKINSHICDSFHQTVKYGHQRNRLLQDLTRLEN